MNKNINLKFFKGIKPLSNYLLTAMRTFLLMITIGLGSAFANSSYTQKEIDIDVINVTIEQLFEEIQDNSEFVFFYKDKTIDPQLKVTLQMKKKTLATVLNKAFYGTNLKYSIDGRQVVIKKSKSNQSDLKASVIEETPVNQEFKLTGTVLDADGIPLPGASIIEKGTTNGTETDFDGNFSLTVSDENAILVISFIGFTTLEQPVDGNAKLRVTLQENDENLDEVVIIGYGKQKRASVTGAVASVSNKTLTIAPTANVSQSLAGRLPGLISKQESGLPGNDAASLSIRGFGAPLVIVDGIPSAMNNIDNESIESITILKDASAAVYGARAGNGVILVTTKRGKEGKTNITFKTAMSFQKPADLIKLASSGQWAELSREAHTNSGQPESTQQYTQEEVDLYYAGTDPDYPNTDWADVTMRDNAPMRQYSLAIRGGNEKIKYYGNIGFLDQETMFKPNAGGFKRYNLRSNVDAQITDNLSAQLDISHIWGNQDLPWRMANAGGGNIWQEYWNTYPTLNSTNPDGSLAYGGSGGAVGIHATSNRDHGGYNKNENEQLQVSMAMNYDLNSLLPGLKARAFANINQSNTFNKFWRYLPNSYTYNYTNDTYAQNNFQTAPDLVHRDTRNRQLTGQFSLNYNNTFAENHEVSALALYEVIDTNNAWVQAARGGYTTTAIQYLFNGGVGQQTSDGRASEMGRQSLVLRGNYAYKSKYLLEATLRVDESAKFNTENRRGSFPSVSLGWRISEESFLENSDFVNNLKLRLSYSETGFDNVGNFRYLSGYQAANLYTIGSSPTNGLISTGLANPDLTWEQMTIYNAGVDYSLLKGKIFGEFDIFWRDRTGVPGQRVVSLPDTFGAILPTENLNAQNTRGFEFSMGYNGSIKDFSYKVAANISYSRSKWASFDEPEYEDEDQARQKIKTGQWTDRVFGWRSQGLFTTQEEIDALDFVYDEVNGNSALAPGDIRYQDVNGDGLLDWKDRVEIGAGNRPNCIVGLNFDLNYKGFDMSAFFQGGLGFTQQVNFRYGAGYSELMYNNRWTPENNNANGLMPRVGGSGTNNSASDFYRMDSSYLRFKTLSIGYSLPQSILEQLQVQNLRFYFAGTNLLTFSKVGDYQVDPESPSNLGGFYYPLMRTISFGLNLSL
jgi:TonB-linked SusC/RagA family outer membrane protein|tara:strand:+ start:904 stop:4317 length:3414 start_codon:yes stop_codon:yes gene_type:complete